MSVAQHHIIKEAGDTLGQLLQNVFKENGYKRVHLVVAAPKQEAIEGKLPAVCVYLYNITVDEEGIQGHRGEYIEKVVDESGRVREVAKFMPIWIRLDFLVSTWAQTPEEEQLLMGCVIKGLLEHPTVRGAALKGQSFEKDAYLPLSLTQKLDEGMLSRFWSSINQPMKPAVQCWTTVPIFPAGEKEIKRVTEAPEMRFFDLNRVERSKP